MSAAEQFESAMRSTFADRFAPDQVELIARTGLSFFLRFATSVAQTPAPRSAPVSLAQPTLQPTRATILPPPLTAPRRLDFSLAAERVDLQRAIRPGSPRPSGGGVNAPWRGPFGDAELVALSRDTAWWTEAGDFYDSRPHLLVLYSIAKWVNWPDPESRGPVRPPVVLEIGVREGISTMPLLYAMRETGGLLHSLECDAEAAEKAACYVDQAKLSQWWALHVINSNDFEPPETLDLLWIDGDHSEAQVRADVERYLPRVRVNGLCLLHDYFENGAATNADTGVAIVVNELRQRPEFEVLTLPWGFGLTMVRRLE
jgi:hypothetical protein